MPKPEPSSKVSALRQFLSFSLFELEIHANVSAPTVISFVSVNAIVLLPFINTLVRTLHLSPISAPLTWASKVLLLIISKLPLRCVFSFSASSVSVIL